MSNFPRWNYWCYDKDDNFIFDEFQIDDDHGFHYDEMGCDYAVWSSKLFWDIDEATALSFGKDPAKVTWDDKEWGVKDLDGSSTFATHFCCLRETIEEAQKKGVLPQFFPPHMYVEWTRKCDVDLPHMLIEGVTKAHLLIDGLPERALLAALVEQHEKEAWEAKQKILWLEYKLAKADDVTPPADKALGSRERNTLLRILLGLAIKHYKWPQPSSYAVAQKMCDALLQLESKDGRFVAGEQFNVSAQTVATKLREAEQSILG